VLLVVEVPWRDVGRGTFLPELRFDRSFIAALIAVFGTTISPYLFFWQTSEEVEEEKDLGEPPKVATKHIRAVRADVISGMVAAVGIMFAIMVASAATLGAHGLTNVETADQAARALEPLAGRFAGTLFALGIIGTGALAVPVLAGPDRLRPI
jgi:Mn2+/Fe2+ NRAMP family transporter